MLLIPLLLSGCEPIPDISLTVVDATGAVLLEPLSLEGVWGCLDEENGDYACFSGSGPIRVTAEVLGYETATETFWAPAWQGTVDAVMFMEPLDCAPGQEPAIAVGLVEDGDPVTAATVTYTADSVAGEITRACTHNAGLEQFDCAMQKVGTFDVTVTTETRHIHRGRIVVAPTADGCFPETVWLEVSL